MYPLTKPKAGLQVEPMMLIACDIMEEKYSQTLCVCRVPFAPQEPS